MQAKMDYWRVRWFTFWEVQPWLWVARMLPARLRYWAVIVAAAEATTGQYGNTEVPALPLDTFLRRIAPHA